MIFVELPPILFLTQLIYKRCIQYPNIHVAEIGVWDGSTTVSYLPLIQQNQGRAYLIDWFKGCENDDGGVHKFNTENKDNIKNRLMHNISVLNCQNTSVLLDGISWECSKYIPDESLDICFIDASHLYEDVLKDIKYYMPKIKRGGIICGHDCQDIFKAGGPYSFSEEELKLQYVKEKGHIGVMQAVFDIFGTNVHTNIPPIPEGQGCPLWLKQL